MDRANFIMDLMAIVASDAGMERTVQCLSQHLQGTVVLTDTEFRLIAYHEHQELAAFGLEDYDTHMTLIQGQERDRVEDHLLEQGQLMVDRVMTIGGQEIPMTLIKLVNEGQLLAYVLLTGPAIQESPMLAEDIRNQWTGVLVFDMVRYFSKNRSGGQLNNDFVNNVLMGNITDKKELIAMCDMQDFDFSLKRICVFIKPARKANMTKDDLYRQEMKIASTVNQVCRRESMNSLKLSYRGNMILFLFFSQDKDNNTIYTAAREVTDQLEEAISQYKLTYGLGKCYQGIDHIGKSFKQSIKAINLGSRIHDSQQIYSYFEDYVFHALNEGLSYGELSELYEDTVQALELVDQSSGSELMATLNAYIECKYKANDTAKALHLHRNTLAYRLDKIKEIMNCEFEDAKENARIQMGIYAKKLLDIHDHF